MWIDLVSALKSIGESYPFFVSHAPPPVILRSEEIRFAAPLETSGSFFFDGTFIAVQGTLKTELSLQCARCAERFRAPLILAFDERYGKTPSDDHFIYEGERINLEEMLLTSIILQMPIASLCRPDCRGICPGCGVNLNEADCACSRQVST